MFLAEPPLTPEISEAFNTEQREDGYVMNLSRLWAWRQDVQTAFVNARKVLAAGTSLSPRESAVIVCATVSTTRDSYCSMAWGTRLAGLADPATAAEVLEGKEPAALTRRERALARWARKVVDGPNSTSAQEIAELRAAGLDDREIFDATVLIAFRQAFSTVNAALGVPPDAELAAEMPAEVRSVVTFGRPPESAGTHSAAG
jgi:uncharacterized peroxidase-related enzyme